MLRGAAAAVLLALAASAPAQDAGGVGRLDVRLALRPGVLSGVTVAVARPAVAGDRSAPAPCPVDWCQAVVDVPGKERAHARVSRSELVATLLDAAELGPVAELVWMIARTGLELDWRPAQLERASGNASGRGSVTLWLKLRMDAWGRVSWAGGR